MVHGITNLSIRISRLKLCNPTNSRKIKHFYQKHHVFFAGLHFAVTEVENPKIQTLSLVDE